MSKKGEPKRSHSGTRSGYNAMGNVVQTLENMNNRDRKKIGVSEILDLFKKFYVEDYGKKHEDDADIVFKSFTTDGKLLGSKITPTNIKTSGDIRQKVLEAAEKRNQDSDRSKQIAQIENKKITIEKDTDEALEGIGRREHKERKKINKLFAHEKQNIGDREEIIKNEATTREKNLLREVEKLRLIEGEFQKLKKEIEDKTGDATPSAQPAKAVDPKLVEAKLKEYKEIQKKQQAQKQQEEENVKAVLKMEKKESAKEGIKVKGKVDEPKKLDKETVKEVQKQEEDKKLISTSAPKYLPDPPKSEYKIATKKDLEKKDKITKVDTGKIFINENTKTIDNAIEKEKVKEKRSLFRGSRPVKFHHDKEHILKTLKSWV